MIDMTGQMMYRVQNLNTESTRISYQMSTGKVLQNGSDDSVLYSQLIGIEDNIRVYDGLQKQVEKTTAQNNVTDSSMNEIKSTLDLIKIDLMKALNEGMDESSRSALATNINGLRENLFSISNTNVDGVYLLSGSDTTKQSFVKDANFELNGKVSYGGDGILRKVAVEPNTYRERGMTGFDALLYNSSTAGAGEILTFTDKERIIDERGQEWKLNGAKDKLQQYDKSGNLIVPNIELAITGDSATPVTYTTNSGEITGTIFLEAKHNFFDDLNIMINALKGYSTNTDGTKNAQITESESKDILKNSLSQATKQYDASNIGHAELGGRNNIFNISLEKINTKLVHYNILQQEVGGADMSKLAMESKSLEMTYQALYSTVAKMHSLSLLNFIK